MPSWDPSRAARITLVRTREGHGLRSSSTVGGGDFEEGRLGELCSCWREISQIFSRYFPPGTAGYAELPCPLGCTPPCPLLPSTFSKSSLFWRKVDLRGPQFSHKPAFTLCSHTLRGCRDHALTVRRHHYVMLSARSAPYLEVIRPTWPPQGQGNYTSRERCKSWPRNTNRLAGGTHPVCVFKMDQNVPLKSFQTCEGTEHGWTGSSQHSGLPGDREVQDPLYGADLRPTRLQREMKTPRELQIPQETWGPPPWTTLVGHLESDF